MAKKGICSLLASWDITLPLGTRGECGWGEGLILAGTYSCRGRVQDGDVGQGPGAGVWGERSMSPSARLVYGGEISGLFSIVRGLLKGLAPDGLRNRRPSELDSQVHPHGDEGVRGLRNLRGLRTSSPIQE